MTQNYESNQENHNEPTYLDATEYLRDIIQKKERFVWIGDSTDNMFTVFVGEVSKHKTTQPPSEGRGATLYEAIVSANNNYDELQMFLELGMEKYESGKYEKGWVNIYSPTNGATNQEWVFVTKRSGHDDEFFNVPIQHMTEYGPSDNDRANLDLWLAQVFEIYSLDTDK